MTLRALVAAAWLAVLAGCGADAPPAVASVPPDTLDGVPVPADALRATYNHVVESDVLRFDPVAIVRLRGGIDVTHEWPEHERGAITIRTNARGLRSDDELARPGSARRVLVVGDSHTFGFVDDDECVHERLETLLEERTGDDFEVVNAGVGGTGPFEYEGSARAFAGLAPEAIVVIVYSGNDFRDALIVDDLVAGRPKHGLDGAAAERLTTVREAWPRRTCLSQGYVQALVFTEFGEATQQRAVDASHRALSRLADDADAPVVFAVLPTKPDVDGDDDAVVLTAVRDQLGLDAQAYAVNRRMARALVDRLAADGRTVLDLHDAMLAEPAPLFWRRDMHLSTRGHDVVARELLPAVLGALGEG